MRSIPEFSFSQLLKRSQMFLRGIINEIDLAIRKSMKASTDALLETL